MNYPSKSEASLIFSFALEEYFMLLSYPLRSTGFPEKEAYFFYIQARILE